MLAPWQAIETVVRQAMEEDVDVIGIISLATTICWCRN